MNQWKFGIVWREPRKYVIPLITGDSQVRSIIKLYYLSFVYDCQYNNVVCIRALMCPGEPTIYLATDEENISFYR